MRACWSAPSKLASHSFTTIPRSVHRSPILFLKVPCSLLLVPLVLSNPAAGSFRLSGTSTGAPTTHAEVQATVCTVCYTAANHKRIQQNQRARVNQRCASILLVLLASASSSTSSSTSSSVSVSRHSKEKGPQECQLTPAENCTNRN
jgi:hypothetical protein